MEWTGLTASDQPAEVNRQDALAEERLGHLAIPDPERNALHNSGLAHTGFAEQDGIVLAPPAQDLHDALDLFVAPDGWVELVLLSQLSEVDRVFFERGTWFGLPGAKDVAETATTTLAWRRRTVGRMSGC